jgi:hypothetical protein
MPTGAQPVVRAAGPDWQRRLGDLAALHRRLGFTEAGRLAAVGRKHGRWVDTVLMQKDLGVPR